MRMDELAALFLRYIIAGVVLFLTTAVLLRTLRKRVEQVKPEWGKIINYALLLLLAAPVGLIIYQFIASSQYHDTNNTFLYVIFYSPKILLGFDILLICAHIYLTVKSKH